MTHYYWIRCGDGWVVQRIDTTATGVFGLMQGIFCLFDVVVEMRHFRVILSDADAGGMSAAALNEVNPKRLSPCGY